MSRLSSKIPTSTLNNIANQPLVSIEQPVVSSSSIFVGGIPHNITVSALESYFSQFGTVAKIDLPRHFSSGKLRGFCFVHFQSESQAESVLKGSPHVLNGKKMAVRRAVEQKEASDLTKTLQHKKLYVSNLPASSQITEELV